jgi:hypothetical protein
MLPLSLSSLSLSSALYNIFNKYKHFREKGEESHQCRWERTHVTVGGRKWGEMKMGTVGMGFDVGFRFFFFFFFK